MIGVSMSTIIGCWLRELVGLLPATNRYTRSLGSLFHQSVVAARQRLNVMEPVSPWEIRGTSATHLPP